MVVFGQYFLQLLKMLPLGARDTHGCLVHLGDRVVISCVLSPSLWLGSPLVCVVDLVAHRTIREVLQTPQVHNLRIFQHCCVGECCLKIQHGEVSQESVVHLFDFIMMVSSCGSYYITVLGRLAKISGAP